MAQPNACLERMKQGLILFKRGMMVHPFFPAGDGGENKENSLFWWLLFGLG